MMKPAIGSIAATSAASNWAKMSLERARMSR